jgi:ankyrin repeat protein
MMEFLQSAKEDVSAILKEPDLFGGLDAIQRSIYSDQQPVFDYLMTLVDCGLLNLNFVSDGGITALHAAAFQTDNTWYIQSLLDQGCDPHTRLEDGRTPFLNALLPGNFEGARLLAESQHCDKSHLFDEPDQHGYVLFGSVIGIALTNYRNRIGVREIEFLDSLSATNFTTTWH